jgi:hypothetical protein
MADTMRYRIQEHRLTNWTYWDVGYQERWMGPWHLIVSNKVYHRYQFGSLAEARKAVADHQAAHQRYLDASAGNYSRVVEYAPPSLWARLRRWWSL